MRYQELVDEIERYESKYRWEERIYLETVKKLRDVQKNLRILDNKLHLQGVVKPFLINWGRMGRVVGREGLQWETLGEILRNLESEFQKLRGEKIININFGDKDIADAIRSTIRSTYGRRYLVPYLVGVTTISKILHILNPEVFVMWDSDIRKTYKKINWLIRETPEGYLEFLKEMKKQLEEAFNDHQSKTGKSYDEIERELRNRYNDKTLAKLVDEYNWIKER